MQMTTTNDVRAIALAKLKVAPENARHGLPIENLEGLAANIATHGQLSPLLAYEKKGVFFVAAGARRLAALELNKAKTADVKVIPQTEATAASLAENAQREQMKPIDEALAWSKMVSKKRTDAEIAEIASSFGVSERIVRQRLKLADLHPTIFAALKAEKLPLAAAEAYAIAPPERQAAIFKRLGAHASRNDIRREFSDGKLEATDRLAIFVGEEAYRAAGGDVEVDLFAESTTPDPNGDAWEADEKAPPAYWTDRELVDRLVHLKIEEAVRKLQAEGWGFVETGDHYPYGHYTEGKAAKTKDEKAKGGAFLFIDRKGKLEIKRNLLKGKAAKQAAASGGLDLRGKAKKPKAPPMTNTTHELTTRIAGRIVGRQLASWPSIALVALVAQLARAHFGVSEGSSSHGQDVLEISFGRDWSPRRNVEMKLATDAKWQGLETSMEDQLMKHTGPALEEYLASLPTERVLEHLAFLVGQHVNVAESAPGTSYKYRRAKLVALARLAKTSPAEHWTPDKAWLMGLDRGVLSKIAHEFAIPISTKKGVQCEAIAKAAAERKWTPPLLAELVGLAVEAPAAKKPAAKKAAKVSK